MKANKNESFWGDCAQRYFLNKILETIFQNHQYDLAEVRAMLFIGDLISHLGEEQGQLEAYGSTVLTPMSRRLGKRSFNEAFSITL